MVYAGDYDKSVTHPNQPIPSGELPGQGTGTDTQMNNPGSNNLNKSFPPDSNMNNSAPLARVPRIKIRILSNQGSLTPAVTI